MLFNHPFVSQAHRNCLNSANIPRDEWNILPFTEDDLENNPNLKFNPCIRYDYGVFYWAFQVSGVIDRLQEIIDMMGRGIYKRKTDDLGQLKKEWALYNYEFYTLIYQSVVDVCCLLINEIFNLGIPYRDCKVGSILSNMKIKYSSINDALNDIANISSKHRQIKNLLLHRGHQLDSHPGMRTMSEFSEESIKSIANSLGHSVEDTKKLIRHFLASVSKEQLIPEVIQQKEQMEEKVSHLFDLLLPIYIEIRKPLDYPPSNNH